MISFLCLKGILNNISSSHETSGVMCNKEAHAFTQFLDLFFGRKEEQEPEANDSSKKQGNFLAKLVKKLLRRLKSEDENEEQQCESSIDYAAYSAEAAQDLHDLCFVKFD